MVTHNKLYLGLHSAQWRVNRLHNFLHVYPAIQLSKHPGNCNICGDDENRDMFGKIIVQLLV